MDERNTVEQYRAKLLTMSQDELCQVTAFPLGKTLGIVWVELTLDRIVATMPVTPLHHQPFGCLHGGVSLLLAETVAGMGGFLNSPPGKAAFGVEINANHLRSVRAGILRAISTPLHVGRTTQVWDIRIWDEAERLVCVSRCTMAVGDLEPSPESAAHQAG
jgi:uncharacterized protein (TIGR00369 family)